MRIPTTLILTMILALLGCVNRPENVAATINANAFGIAYSGKLLRMEPIFFTGTQARYSSSAGSAAGLAANVIFRDNLYLFQLESISNSLGTAYSSEREESVRGGYCQYFVQTSDDELLRGIKSQFGVADGQTADPYSDFLQGQLQQEQYDLDNMHSQAPNAQYEAQLLELGDRINQTRQKLNERSEAPAGGVIMTVNPCRDFSPGDKVVVSRTSTEIIIERDWR